MTQEQFHAATGCACWVQDVLLQPAMQLKSQPRRSSHIHWDGWRTQMPNAALTLQPACCCAGLHRRWHPAKAPPANYEVHADCAIRQLCRCPYGDVSHLPPHA